ncbi:hypothetical protein DFQ00_105116 [Paenibacillus barcinonensis]|uniref:YqkK n=1 Tax=Paenibacillus barcinonensis TaxID=198119 RepID=A0A2V4WP35_PAEBA|nr:hypothetical protein [Paenibacillus barcinonensis]PYE49612.1 hypothetical protein DFQ00_105116 [Paenibacillus barcinonensis]
MARTQTQKALRKAARSGQWCPEQSRRINGDYGALSQHVRLTPTKQEKLQKVKHKKQIIRDGGASFYFVLEREKIRKGEALSSSLHAQQNPIL